MTGGRMRRQCLDTTGAVGDDPPAVRLFLAPGSQPLAASSGANIFTAPPSPQQRVVLPLWGISSTVSPWRCSRYALPGAPARRSGSRTGHGRLPSRSPAPGGRSLTRPELPRRFLLSAPGLRRRTSPGSWGRPPAPLSPPAAPASHASPRTWHWRTLPSQAVGRFQDSSQKRCPWPDRPAAAGRRPC